MFRISVWAGVFLLLACFVLPMTAQQAASSSSVVPGTITGSGTADFIPRFTGTTTIGNSNIFETVGGNVGVATTTPSAKLDVNGTGDVRDTLTLFPKLTHPTLSVHGTAFAVSHTGLVTFVSGQTFPGTGTVTSVGLSAPASDFTVSGSPVTHSGTLGLAWTVAPTSTDTANAIVKRDGSGNFSAGAITAGSLGVTGNISTGSGVTFPDGTTQQTAALFETVANTGLIFPGSGVTNMLQLNITVPANGFLSASASGYCNVNTGSSGVQWAYVIGQSASEGWSFPEPLVYLPSGTNQAQFPISGERVFSVSAGANSIFLNVDNLIGTALSSCGGQLTTIFTPAQLPPARPARAHHAQAKGRRAVANSAQGVVGTPE
jgi:hypothetical protein